MDDTATWVLGSFFFVFILGFIVYVVATEVPAQRVTQKAVADGRDVPWGDSWIQIAGEGRRSVSVGYRLLVDRTTIVNYPFGLRVVINGSRAGSHLAPGDRDAEILEGELQFETTEAAPVLRVQVRFAPGDLQLPEAWQEGRLTRAQETVYSFWPSPVESWPTSLTVAISHVAAGTQERLGTVPGRYEGDEVSELATIPLTISPVAFPIRLR